MEPVLNVCVLAGGLIWLAVLAAPWRPWSTRERLAPAPRQDHCDLRDITVLIPARNEKKTIASTLAGLTEQGDNLTVILVDDQSTDGTAATARTTGIKKLHIIPCPDLPSGWSGKLWALEQGRGHVRTPLTLLIDADIRLRPGMLPALRKKMVAGDVQLVSLMAQLRMEHFWEKMLVPAFVFFFKLLYPFHLSNSGFRYVAAAAGGCILLETRLLEEIGGFESLRNELIDDCSLARKVKHLGCRTWIGLTHSVQSTRSYNTLAPIWNMVARTAFTQLRYSALLLVLCSLMLVTAFWAPLLGLALGRAAVKTICCGALMCMVFCYLPTLLFYRRCPLWALLLPVIGTLYLAMTWTSALRCWRGKRSQWKGRIYAGTERQKGS